MTFRVSGKNIDLGEALRTRVSSRIAEAVGKYFNGGYSGHVTVGKEAFGFLRRLSGLLSGYPPIDTRPQARAKLGRNALK